MNDDRFDDLLRNKLEGYCPDPDDKVWEKIQARTGRRRWALPAALVSAAAAAAAVVLFLIPGQESIPDVPQSRIYVAGIPQDEIVCSNFPEIIRQPVYAKELEMPDIPENTDNTDITEKEEIPEEVSVTAIEESYELPSDDVYPVKSRQKKGRILLAMAATPGIKSTTGGINAGTFTSENLTPALELQHDIPVSYGISAGYAFNERLAAVTGINYTLYRSTGITPTLAITQKLHYISVPLNLQYSFFNDEYMYLYAFAGGSVDFCISGEVAQRKMTIPAKPEFTLNAGLGMGIRISRSISIFAEPAYVHYFNSPVPVLSYRTTNPDTFHISVGIRFGI